MVIEYFAELIWFTSYLVWYYQIRRDAIGSRSAISSLLLHESILTPTELMINNTPMRKLRKTIQYEEIDHKSVSMWWQSHNTVLGYFAMTDNLKMK